MNGCITPFLIFKKKTICNAYEKKMRLMFLFFISQNQFLEEKMKILKEKIISQNEIDLFYFLKRDVLYEKKNEIDIFNILILVL